MSKDWLKNNNDNIISPTWNSGYQRYDISIDEVIFKIKEAGYRLEFIEYGEEDELDEFKDYILEIHSKKGVVISDKTSLVLEPKVYCDGVDITDSLDMRYFKWVRSSTDPKEDAEWNLRHAIGIKNLEITHEDVWKRAVFHCALLTGAAESNFVTNMYTAYQASINN